MNITQLTEAVAAGASPLAVIEVALKEGVGTMYLKQPTHTFKDLGSQPKLGKPVQQLTHIGDEHMVGEHHSGSGYAVHLDRSVVAPDTSYTMSAAHSPHFNEYMRSSGLGHLVKHAGSHGYDDVTLDFKHKDHAVAAARALDSVLPGPSKNYKQSYDPDNAFHHAAVVQYDWQDGLPEGGANVIDHMHESIDEGKPSGISRAFDQPERSAKQKAKFDKDLAYYDKSGSEGDRFNAGQAARMRAQGPDLDYHTSSERAKYLGRYQQGNRTPANVIDRSSKKTYSQLPPVLQRLVKKNVRADAAEPRGSGYRRGPLAGKTGYQAYDIRHQAKAAVGFSPADRFKSQVDAGHKIDPAVNQREKDHDSFKDALFQLSRSPGAKHGVQSGKQVTVAGSASWDKKYAHITHVHHPQHGEIQLFSPDNAKDEPTVYHRPTGAGRGKMHKWSSPEAQKIVQDVMSSGHE